MSAVSSEVARGAVEGDTPLLEVRGLEKHYVEASFLGRERQRVRAVDGVSFAVREGETLGLVGESGCGKSTVARTLLRLEAPTGGTVRFDGTPVESLSGSARREFRRRTGTVFQDPASSFDPRMTVGQSVAEPLRVQGVAEDQHRPVVTDLLERVGLESSDADRYPHEFSGGQKQRLALARALVTNPDLLVADEPVSALDVSVQAGVLGLLDEVKDRFDLSMLLVTHDMGVVRQVCDRVAVMYLGELVEVAPTETLFEDPRHPYTRALLGAVPDPNPDPATRRETVELRGDVPDPSDPPTGCRFHTRCPEVVPPESLDVEQSAFRAVMDLRVAIRSGRVDLETLRSRAAERADVTTEAVGVDRLASTVRERFSIPELSADEAEACLAAALREVAAGEFEDASDRLTSRFRSPCETRSPPESEFGAGRVHCHLETE